MNGDGNADNDNSNLDEALDQAWANKFKSSSEPKNNSKKTISKVTRLTNESGGYRYLDVSKEYDVTYISWYYGVERKQVITVNKERLNKKFHKGIVPAGSLILIPEPRDGYPKVGLINKEIGGRKGHRAGINVEMGLSLMKKGYNPSITY